MDFSENTIKKAWDRSGGKCEKENCKTILMWDERGKESIFGWEAHHKDENGPDAPSNCLILCQKCHKNTLSYGG